MTRGAASNHCLMIRAGQEEVTQPSRVDLFQLKFGRGRDRERPAGPRVIHRLAVGGGGERNVIRVLVAALDL